MIKAIIFDCFGVLIGRGFDETYRQAGGDPEVDHEFIDSILDRANRGQISRADFRSALAQKLMITTEQFEKAIQTAEQLNIALCEYIITLRNQYKTAVLSNVNAGGLELRVGREWLEKCFDTWVASAEVGFIKPEPEIYELTATRLGVSVSECIFIDDIERYVAAAKELGMQGIVYRDFTQMKQELEALLAANPDD